MEDCGGYCGVKKAGKIRGFLPSAKRYMVAAGRY
jgi:hypothetical protein